MAIVVRFLSGARRGAEMQLDTERFRVGGDSSCDVFFDPESDPTAKGRSAIIQRKEDGWYVRCTGDAPLLLNHAQLVGESRLRSGDVLRMSESGPDLMFAMTAPVSGATTHQDPLPSTLSPAPPEQERNAAGRSAEDDGPAPPRSSIRRPRSVWWTSAGVALTVLILGAFALTLRNLDPQHQPTATGDKVVDLAFLSSPLQVTAEGRELLYRVPMKAPPELRDKLVFSLVGQPPPGTSIDPVTGQLRWTPTEEQGPGRYPVTVQAMCRTDTNLTAETTFWVDVREVNSPPAVDSPDDRVVDAGQLLTFQLRVIDPDRPINRPEFRKSSGPAWVSVEAASGLVRCEPPETEDGLFEVAIQVIDDGEPPLSHSTLLKLKVRGDPWQRVADDLRKTVWLAQMEVDGATGSYSWPFATCCAIDSHTLLASAREVLQLANWHHQQDCRIWIASPSHKDRLRISGFRVHREFVPLASRPNDWIFVNLGLLITEGSLPSAARVVSSADQPEIEEGLPIVCYGFTHDGDKITRFDRFEAAPYRGEVYLITPSPSLPGRRTLLEIKATIPQNVYGSPIVTSQGDVIGLYGESASSTGAGVNDLHYATALDREAIAAWLSGDETDWVSLPISPQS